MTVVNDILENFRVNVAATIRRRGEQGWSKAKICRKAGISICYLPLMLNVRQQRKPLIPGLDKVLQICRALEVPLEEALKYPEFFSSFLHHQNGSYQRIRPEKLIANFRQNLDWCFREFGVDAGTVSQRTGISLPYLSRIRRGSPMPATGKPMIPSLRHALHLANAFGLELPALLQSPKRFRSSFPRRLAKRLRQQVGSA